MFAYGKPEATGVFAGRTGRVGLSGTNDLTRFAAGELHQDAFWIINLNRKPDRERQRSGPFNRDRSLH